MLNVILMNPILMASAKRATERVKRFAYDLVHDENGEVNIVATVVLIGIAVGLAIVFKGRIEELLKHLFDSLGGRAEAVVRGEGN